MSPRSTRTICFVVGARPNFMKAAPVHAALGKLDPSLKLLLVHTGQHYDDAMSAVFIDELNLPRPDVFLGVGSGTHAQQTARALERIEEVLLAERPDLVVVPGDVNSTLAAALAAVKIGIPVAHLEAGLRSFDPSMPEEHNRRLTDHLSNLLLVHSESAVENLRARGNHRARRFRRQHDDRLRARAPRRCSRRGAVGALRTRARRVPSRHAPPTSARGRSRRAAGDGERAWSAR